MKRLPVFLFAAFLFLMPVVVCAQSDQTAKAPPISQPLVREGDFAVKLVEGLKIGTAKDEVEAESMLASSGIAPKNGWIADYPVTPDIIGELENAVGEAADSKRLPMVPEEAVKAFQKVTFDAGLPIAVDTSGKYAEAPPPESPQYADPGVIDNYYYSEGPPVVTYYPPPWDYAYMYAWVPSPFFCSGFFFSGFFILHDFHKVIIINKKAAVVTNHFIDPKSRRVFVIDHSKSGTGREFRAASHGRGFSSTEGHRGAASIFNRSQGSGRGSRGGGSFRSRDSGSGGSFERGAAGSGRMPERSGRGFSAAPSRGGESGRGSSGGSHGGSFSHGGSRGGCVGRC